MFFLSCIFPTTHLSFLTNKPNIQQTTTWVAVPTRRSSESLESSSSFLYQRTRNHCGKTRLHLRYSCVSFLGGSFCEGTPSGRSLITARTWHFLHGACQHRQRTQPSSIRYHALRVIITRLSVTQTKAQSPPNSILKTGVVVL